MTKQKTIKTTYRKLENFLYLMGIAPLQTVKEWDGSTAWEYEDTAELRLATKTFKELEAQLKTIREGVSHE